MQAEGSDRQVNEVKECGLWDVCRTGFSREDVIRYTEKLRVLKPALSRLKPVLLACAACRTGFSREAFEGFELRNQTRKRVTT
ncbi:hypothetical protein AO263_21670 [Pseudomonas sp. NZIPFR-PS5]|nr:hypothetical protein AO263_21670 [Pseudomonas sp. NZIPFR-PS5]